MEQIVYHFCQKMSRDIDNRKVVANTQRELLCEQRWTQKDRPYYDLYPSVAEAFTKIDLDKINCEMLKLPIPELLIRLPVGQEIQESPTSRVRTVLVCEDSVNDDHGWLVIMNTGAVFDDGFPNHTLTSILLESGTTIMHHLTYGREHPYCDDSDVDAEAMDNVVRIVTTLCLLKGNPDLIEPLPLEADREKWESAHDIKLIEKAKSKGKRGWAIGKHIECAPGFRNPHFAIRWCGKGGSDPQVRPIKGCFVRRQKIVEVPTDWLGPEEVTELSKNL